MPSESHDLTNEQQLRAAVFEASAAAAWRRVGMLEGVLTRIRAKAEYQSHPLLMEITGLCREALEGNDETNR